MTRVALIGSGWRAESWAKLLQRLSDFSLSAVLVRNGEKEERFRALGARTVRTEEGALAGCDLVLVCVSKQNLCDVCDRLVRRGAAVLSETPAGINREERKTFDSFGEQVQVAEQYPWRPQFRALHALTESGMIGKVNSVTLSCCHDYHAVSLMRKLLSAGRPVEITAVRFPDSFYETADRRGDHAPCRLDHSRIHAVLRFGDKVGIYDFTKAQYFSELRQNRVLIRGTRGEIAENEGFRLEGNHVFPFRMEYRYGGGEGRFDRPELLEIVCEGRRLYENPFRGSGFNAEEIAMAESLTRATAFFRGGESFYSASEAVLDSETAAALCGE